MQPFSVQLKRFDPSKMKDNCICVVTGKRNTGKSVLLTDLLSHKRHIPSIVVMSETEGANRHFGHYVPDLFIHHKFDADVLHKIIQRQKRLKQMNHPNPECIIVLDDVAQSKQDLGCPELRTIAFVGRHLGITLFMSTQFLYMLQPWARMNIDYFFARSEASVNEREKLYRNFFGVIPTFEAFNRIFDECTNNYGVMVLDNTTTSTRLEDCVYYYHADPNVQFRMGSPALWKAHSRRYDPNYVWKEIEQEEDRVQQKKAKKKTRT